MMKTVFDFKVKNSRGETIALSDYKGKVILIVNVASKCGFTPQYEGLEKLFQNYQSKGLIVLGFPCNQFGAQEPGNNDEIQSFCKLNYGVSFPVFGKIDVNGPATDPLYEFLKSSQPGIMGTTAIKWNFTKFLIGKSGLVVERYAPMTKPSDIEHAIQRELNL